MATISAAVTTLTGSSSPYTGGAITVDATADRALYYWITYIDTTTATAELVTGITRDGQSATRVTGHTYIYSGNYRHGELWKISNPNTGSASSSISTSEALQEPGISMFAAYALSGESTPSTGGAYSTAISQSAASTSADDIDLLLVSFNNAYSTDITPTSPLVQVSESSYYGGNWVGSRAGSGSGTTVAGTIGAIRVYAAIGISLLHAGGGDVTAPVLTSPDFVATGSTTGTASVSTDEGNGTLYCVVTTSSTSPSAAQIKAGNDHTGSAAVFAAGSGSGQAVSGTGTQNVSVNGLTASTTYYAHFVHDDAAANESNVATDATGDTTSAPNSAPSWSGTPSAMSAKRGQALTPQDITSLVSDADLDTLSYSITGAPTGVTINSSTGVISGTPTAAPGVYACTVEADDGIASPVSSSSFNITVTQCVLDISGDEYAVGDGNSPATMSVAGSYVWKVNVHDYASDSLGDSAQVYQNASVTAGTNGKLANIGDDDLIFGQWYLLTIRRTTGQLVLSAAIQAS